METFCSYFLDFQFRQFGFSLPTFSLVLGLALSERVAPSFALNLLQIKRWSLLIGISFLGNWRNSLQSRIDCPPVSCLTLSLCTSIGLKSTFLLDSKKVEVKVRRNLSPFVCGSQWQGKWGTYKRRNQPGCLSLAALRLPFRPPSRCTWSDGWLLWQIRCSVQRIKAVVSISQNLSLVSLSPSARPWGWTNSNRFGFEDAFN